MAASNALNGNLQLCALEGSQVEGRRFLNSRSYELSEEAAKGDLRQQVQNMANGLSQ